MPHMHGVTLTVAGLERAFNQLQHHVARLHALEDATPRPAALDDPEDQRSCCAGDEDGGEDSTAANGEAAEKDGASGDGTKRSRPNAPSPAVAVNRVDAKRASGNLARGDAQATSRALQGLNLPNMSGRSTPTPAAIVNSLQQVRQRVITGAPPR